MDNQEFVVLLTTAITTYENKLTKRAKLIKERRELLTTASELITTLGQRNRALRLDNQNYETALAAHETELNGIAAELEALKAEWKLEQSERYTCHECKGRLEVTKRGEPYWYCTTNNCKNAKLLILVR